MNAVRIWIIAMLVTALAAGIGLYYTQVYAFYDEVDGQEFGNVQLVSLHSGAPEPILFENFKAIDSNSSPIRFRACFDTPLSQGMLTETYEIYDTAVPLDGPRWFDCLRNAPLRSARRWNRARRSPSGRGQHSIYGVTGWFARDARRARYIWQASEPLRRVV